MIFFEGNIESDAYEMRWLPCARFPDYEVSEYGDIRRRTAIMNRPLGYVVKGYIMPLSGYVTYSLKTPAGYKTSVAAHILVAEAFLGPKPSPKHEVAHRSGSKKSAYWRDLRWATKVENQKDRVVHKTKAMGHANGNAKLSDEQALKIRYDYQRLDRSKPRSAYGRIKAMAAEYGVCVATIQHISSGLTWRHLPLDAGR